MQRSLVIAAALLTAACTPMPPRPDPIREYIRLAVALGERDPQSLDYYYGPAEWVQDIKAHPPTFVQIARNAQNLRSNLERDPQGAERTELLGQLRALAARAGRLAGKQLTFDQEAEELFDLKYLPGLMQSGLDNVRFEISQLLPGSGPLVDRYAAFERRSLIPSDKQAAVLEASVKACRERTAARVLLPPETIQFDAVHNKPWNAYSAYKGGFHSQVQWNMDFRLTVDRALQLACHETYPGHHVQSILIEQGMVRRAHPERSVLLSFSPQSFLSEALASYAVELAFPESERERFEREVLYPIAGMDPAQAALAFKLSRLIEQLEPLEAGIAREYLDGRLEFARAGTALEELVLMAHTEETLKYLNQYRTYLISYTLGKRMVQNCFRNTTAMPRNQWKLFEQILLGQVQLQSCIGTAH